MVGLACACSAVWCLSAPARPPLSPAWLSAAHAWVVNASEPTLIPLSYRDSDRWLRAAAAADPDFGQHLAEACVGTWQRYGTVRALVPRLQPAALADEATLRAKYPGERNFVASLTPVQLAALANASPCASESFTSAQLDWLKAALASCRQPAPPTSKQETRLAVRVYALPVIRFYRAGGWLGEIVLDGAWDGGYEPAALCARNAQGAWTPVFIDEPLPGMGMWKQGDAQGAIAQARPAAASNETACLQEALGPPFRIAAPEVLTLDLLADKLSGGRQGRCVVDKRLGQARVLLGPAVYEPSSTLLAAMGAYHLGWRYVDGTIFVTSAPPPIAQNGLIEESWALNASCSAALPALMRSMVYPGLVLPWDWFVEARSLSYESLDTVGRQFVENLWFYNKYTAQAIGNSRPAKQNGLRETADSYYSQFGAGTARSASRQAARAELADVSLQCQAGLVLQLAAYRHGWYMAELWDQLPASVRERIGVLPDYWSMAGTRTRCLFPGTRRVRE